LKCGPATCSAYRWERGRSSRTSREIDGGKPRLRYSYQVANPARGPPIGSRRRIELLGEFVIRQVPGRVRRFSVALGKSLPLLGCLNVELSQLHIGTGDRRRSPECGALVPTPEAIVDAHIDAPVGAREGRPRQQLDGGQEASSLVTRQVLLRRATY